VKVVKGRNALPLYIPEEQFSYGVPNRLKKRNNDKKGGILGLIIFFLMQFSEKGLQLQSNR